MKNNPLFATTLLISLLAGSGMAETAPLDMQIQNALNLYLKNPSDTSLAKIKTLFNQGANPNITDEAGTPMLSAGISRNDMSLTAVMVEAGADINKKDGIGLPIFTEAAILGNLEMLKYLINHGAAINTPLPEGESLLCLTTRVGQYPHGRPADEAKKQNLAMIKFMIEDLKLPHDKPCVNGKLPYELSIHEDVKALLKPVQ